MPGEGAQIKQHSVDWNKWMLVVSVLGLGAVVWQLNQTTKATEALVIQSLTSQSEELLSAAIEHPDAARLLFPVYGTPAEPTADDELNAYLLGRSMLCHFEAVLAQEHLMSEEQRQGFRAMMSLLFTISPMLHMIVEEELNPDAFYTRALRQVADENPAASLPMGGGGGASDPM